MHAHETQETPLDGSEETAPRTILSLIDPRHVRAERIAERAENDDVDEDLRDALGAHLETLPAQQRIDQIRENANRDDQSEEVARRHHTRSSANRIANANAKQASAIASASMSAMQPRYDLASEACLKVERFSLKKL